MFSCSSACCWHPRSDETWALRSTQCTYYTSWKTLYGLGFCAHETVDGIQQQWRYHRRSRKRTAYQAYSAFVKTYGIFRNTPTMSLSTVTTANWRFTPIHMLHTECSTAGGKGNIGSQIQTTACEIALSRKPFEIGHMYTYFFFCLKWPILWPPM
jgi:hypothetical protein